MLDIHVVTLLLEQETLFNLHLERKFLNNAHGLDKVGIYFQKKRNGNTKYLQAVKCAPKTYGAMVRKGEVNTQEIHCTLSLLF